MKQVFRPPARRPSNPTLVRTTLRIAAFVSLSLCLSCIALSQTTYAVTDIGALPGGVFSVARGVNSSGHVTGYSFVGNSTHAFFWSRSTGIVDIGAQLVGSSIALGINDSDEVVGNDNSGAFIWSRRKGVLRIPPPAGSSLTATAINNRGQVTGWTTSTRGIDHAFLWSAQSGIVDAGTLPRGLYSQGIAINASGQIAGGADTGDGPFHLNAIVFDPRKGFTDFGDLPGATQTIANGINNSGQITGSSGVFLSPNIHAFVSGSTGALIDIGILPGTTWSEAFAINQSGIVVGTSVGSTLRAFLYSPRTGMIDLNTQIPANLGWQLQSAFAINNSGQIAGSGAVNGLPHAFLLTPR